MPDDLEIRLLRHFVAVAEELHVTRAAQRLFVAQQALSRDIRRLEDRLGVRLLDRTTRRIALTPSGRILLARARELLALHDTTVRELRDEPRSLTVDVVGPDLTPAQVLAVARRKAPDVEFFARFITGTETATPMVLAGELDVTFGRFTGPPDGVRQRAVRYERIAVLLPDRHPLAGLDAVPLTSMRDAWRPCFRSGNHATPGWEHAIRQLLGPGQIHPADGHPHVQGTDELAQHIRDRNFPILTMTTQPAVPGAVLRPLTEPIALFPWAMIWRTHTSHPGLRALHEAIDELATAQDWPSVPEDAWLPRPEAIEPPERTSPR